MDRFVAMIWDQEDQSRLWQVNAWSDKLQRQSPRWIRVLDQPGLRVYSYHHRGEGPVVTNWQGDNGIVVGVLFEQGQEARARVRNLTNSDTARIVSTRGDHLVARYWGNYVGIWRDPETRCTTVLRDPCGAVPCFMTKQNGVDLLFAHADDIAALPALRLSIDWDYVRSFIFFNYFVTKYTGLREVTELLAGERLEWTPHTGSKFSWAWNGAALAANPIIQNFENARTELRATAEACFAAWGAEHHKIVVSLSGGLDSSILVNLLRQVSDAQIIGLHYLGVGYERYEAQLARRAAERAGVELVEVEQDATRDEVQRILRAPRLARPKIQTLAVQIDDIAAKLADRVDATCYMIGQGGDNLFLQRGGANYTLTDYARINGLGSDFWRVAYDASLLRQQPIWKALGDTFKTLLSWRRWQAFGFLDSEDWIKHRPMTKAANQSIPAEYKRHPWFAEATRLRLPPGKADHLNSVVALYNYYIHHGRGLTRDVVYPFFSQPIAELALRTPTYMLAENGLDRALERGAFADIVPPQIVRRTGKSGANAYLLQVMRHNIAFYRELILNGALVREGCLDQDKVERMLTSDFVIHGSGALSVYLLVTVEAWLQTWTYDNARAAA